ncbi:RING-H2 finger protein ATL74-like [Rutidosis leptorrhynchoides]|uniref:RING-H2 finger protein ATL74-like n=1 Tax=Rutidosis leptorrhynchoides TaxID=125765 RepID=UPI003A99D5D9
MVRSIHRLLLSDNPLSEDNTNDSSESEDTNLDADMIVLLAALLCALVAALLLNSVIHIYLRRRHEDMEADATNVQGLGLKKHVLKKIPVAVFKLRTSGNSLATECSICLGEFVDGEKVRVLPECNHEFHVKCVDKWLKDHTSCPNCRRSLVPPKVVDGRDLTTMVGLGGV